MQDIFKIFALHKNDELTDAQARVLLRLAAWAIGLDDNAIAELVNVIGVKHVASKRHGAESVCVQVRVIGESEPG